MSDDLQKELEQRAPPKQSLALEFDADARFVLARLTTEREKFAISAAPPVEVPIPFHVMKEAVAQIISVEIDLHLMKLPGGLATPRSRWPKGLAGAKHVAELLADAAELEKAGRALVDGDGSPTFRPNLGVVLGRSTQ